MKGTHWGSDDQRRAGKGRWSSVAAALTSAAGLGAEALRLWDRRSAGGAARPASRRPFVSGGLSQKGGVPGETAGCVRSDHRWARAAPERCTHSVSVPAPHRNTVALPVHGGSPLQPARAAGGGVSSANTLLLCLATSAGPWTRPGIASVQASVCLPTTTTTTISSTHPPSVLPPPPPSSPPIFTFTPRPAERAASLSAPCRPLHSFATPHSLY